MRACRSWWPAGGAGAAHLACGFGGFLANVSFVAAGPPVGFVELPQVGVGWAAGHATQGLGTARADCVAACTSRRLSRRSYCGVWRPRDSPVCYTHESAFVFRNLYRLSVLML